MTKLKPALACALICTAFQLQAQTTQTRLPQSENSSANSVQPDQLTLRQLLTVAQRHSAETTRDLGRQHPDALLTLANEAAIHTTLAESDAAEAILSGLLEEIEQSTSLEPQVRATVQFQATRLRILQNRASDALPLIEQAHDIRLEALGENHPDTLAAASELGRVYRMLSRNEDANTLLSDVLARATVHLSDQHQVTLRTATYLGSLHHAQGRDQTALDILQSAHNTAENALGAQHPLFVELSRELSGPLRMLGLFDEAETVLSGALASSEEILGGEHPETIQQINALALLYQFQGRYAEVEPLFQRALEIQERVYGEEDFGTLRILNNLAGLYQTRGQYSNAEPLFRRALEIGERSLGPDHVVTLIFLNNLSLLYRYQTRFVEAEALQARALEARSRTLGPTHSHTLVSLNNLGLINEDLGRYEVAEPLLRQSLVGREETLGEEHPSTLVLVNNVATLLERQQRFTEAIPLLERALRVRSSNLGPEHPDTIASLNNLGGLFTHLGQHGEAQTMLERAWQVSARTLGNDHPFSLVAAERLAQSYLSDQPAMHAQALPAARALAEGLRSRRQIATASLFSEAQSDRDRGSESDRFRLHANAAWASRNSSPLESAALVSEAFLSLQDATAGYASEAIRVMALRQLAEDSQTGLGGLVRERDELAERWRGTSQRLSLTFGGSTSDDISIRNRLLAETRNLEARISQLDEQIQDGFPSFAAFTQPDAISFSESQSLLNQEEAILFVVPTDHGTHVIAITQDTVEWHRSELTTDEIDEATMRLRWDLGASVTVDDGRRAELERENPSGTLASFDRTTAHQLYREIVEPISETISDQSQLFVVATGPLSALPFSVLVTETPLGEDDAPAALRNTQWMADDFALAHLPSVQSLHFMRRFGLESSHTEWGSDFDGFGDPILSNVSAIRGRSRGGAQIDSAEVLTARRMRWGGAVVDLAELRQLPRLPGTARELLSLQQTLNAPVSSVRLAEQATEGAVKDADLSSTRILAFATHALIGGQNEMLSESGLVFTPPETASERDDGYLTASEVTELQLAADWVILSACNTAAGDLASPSYGLSNLVRAFFYAGARNLLASHWPVADDVAAELTVRAIELAQGSDGLSRSEALSTAMREIREEDQYDQTGFSWAHPAMWAPFVLIGGS